MRVLHIEMGRHFYGGAQQVAYLIEGLNQKGIESFLLAPENSAIAEKISTLGNQVFTTDYSGDLDIRLAFRVKKIVAQRGIDLVHVHSRRGADVWGGLGAKWADTPAVLSRRVDNPEGRASIQYKYSLYKKIISISEGIKKVLIENGLEQDRVQCVRSAVVATDSQNPVDKSEFLNRFNLPKDALIVGTVAQLIPRKGHKLLLQCLPEILKKFPNMHVLFFGEGAERENLQTQIEALSLSNQVQLVGFHKDLNTLIGNLDLLVHPAYIEGLGVSLIQAASASVPIIASNAGGMPEIVRDQVNGLLFPPGDAHALSTAIEKLANDPELRINFAARGKKIAEEEFSVEGMVGGNLEVYHKVLIEEESSKA